MLNDLTSVTQLNRKYLGWLLRNTGKVVFIKDKTRIIAEPTVSYTSQRDRKAVYTDEVVEALKWLWTLAGFCSSKHLVNFIRINSE